jgi:uncharacterized membrane protein
MRALSNKLIALSLLILPFAVPAQSLGEVRNMSQEERRTAIENMSDDERSVLREQRRAAREEHRQAHHDARQQRRKAMRERWEAMSEEESAEAREKCKERRMQHRKYHAECARRDQDDNAQ